MRNDLTTLDWSIQLKLSDCKSFVPVKCLRGRGNLTEENQLLLKLPLCIVVSFIFPLYYYAVLHCVFVCHRIKNQKKTGSSWFRSLRIKTSVCSSLCLLKVPEDSMQWWWRQYKLVVQPNLPILRSFSLLNLKKRWDWFDMHWNVLPLVRSLLVIVVASFSFGIESLPLWRPFYLPFQSMCAREQFYCAPVNANRWQMRWCVQRSYRVCTK